MNQDRLTAILEGGAGSPTEIQVEILRVLVAINEALRSIPAPTVEPAAPRKSAPRKPATRKPRGA